jgi:hypothetical protein
MLYNKFKGISLFCTYFLIIFISGSCIHNEPVDPLWSLRRAAGLKTPKSGEIHTNLDLNHEWIRACETRTGNLFADAFAWASGSKIGFIASGAIRNDRGIEILNKGLVSGDDLVKVLPFNNKVYLIRLQGFRLKQNLETSASKLSENISAYRGDDSDVDGSQHGDCFFSNLEGGGRFLQVSSSLQILVNTKNQIQEVEGNAADNDLKVTTDGKRIVKISVDGLIIYENKTGDINSGWTEGAKSCKSFTKSAACTFFTVSIGDFHAAGNDEHPAFNPDLAEVNNDGSVLVLSEDMGIDVEIVSDYINYLNNNFDEYKPKIENRILFVE